MAIAVVGLQLMAVLPSHLAIPTNLLLLLLVPRFQRGQENLTHEGSHQNWFRPGARVRTKLETLLASRLGLSLGDRWTRRVNDTLTNSLAAVPTFSTVRSYGEAHRQHHGHFGSEFDPCLSRFAPVDRSRPGAFLGLMLRSIGRYVLGWWLTVGLTSRTFVLGLLWHLCFWVLPWSLVIGWPAGLYIWLVYWAAPFVLLLPWLRYFAESAKHDYSKTTEFDATISNLGWIHRWYLHPHGDGHHLLHHWDPSIPHHLLAKAHTRLLAIDPVGYAGKHPHRRRVFQNAAAGIEPNS